MAHRVRLRPAVSVHRGDDHVSFFDGHRAVTLTGSAEAVERLTAAGRLLAQAHSESELSDALDISQQHTSDVVSALTMFELVTADDPPRDSVSRAERVVLDYADTLGGSSLTAAESLSRLRRHRVVVIGTGAAELAGLFGASGLRTVVADDALPADFDPTTDLIVPVLTDEQDKGAFSRWNDDCLRNGASWLPVAPFDGACVVIGPMMVPGETCCYECFLSRRAANVAFGERFRTTWLSAPGVAAPPALERWAHSVAVLVVLRWIVQASPSVTSRVYRVDPVRMRVDDAYVFPVPRCRACSAAAWLPLPAPWEIE